MVQSKGICTTRVCLFSRTLLKTITDSNFKSPKKKDGRGTELDGLISLLQQYYQDPTATNCRHFVVCPGEFSELYKVKGFFGIELPDNEKHVILGEAINLDKGLTGKVLFNKDKIEAVHKDFVKAQQQDGREIINFLQINASDAFKEYLADKGIAAFKPVKVTR